MASPLEEILDEALFQQWHDGSRTDIPADDGVEAEELRPLLATAETLKILLPVQLPKQSQLTADREQFLHQLKELQTSAVDPGPPSPFGGWLARRLHRYRLRSIHREQNRMSMLVLKGALVLAVAFGSIGGTAALAAESSPDSLFYPLKITVEEARLYLADGPAERALLQLRFAETRLEEIEEMILEGREPGEETMARLQTHLGEALYMAAQTPDETLTVLLNQASEMATVREQTMIRTQAGAGEQEQARLQKSVRLLANLRQTCGAALSDLQGFREEFTRRAQNRFGVDDGWPGSGPGPGPGDCERAEECAQYRERRGSGEDGEGVGDGPGPMDCRDESGCDPMADQHRYGLGEESPGQHGPGPAACLGDWECDPAGAQNQAGWLGDGSGQYGPGPATCDEYGDCEPAEYLNRYGQDDDRGRSGPGSGSDFEDGELHPEQGSDPNQERYGAGPGPEDESGQGGQHQEQNSEHNGSGGPGGNGGEGGDGRGG
jgi:hypothetical protein